MTEGQRSFARSGNFQAKNNLKLDTDANIWYAVYTRPRWEKKVASQLEEKGIIHYCPLNKTTRQWSDRRKVVLEPLFKGYVFVQIAEDKKFEVLEVNGIVNFVYWLGKPAAIRNSEIDIIRRFLHEFEDVQVSKRKLKVQSTVQVKQGVMMNYKGIVLELLGNKALVKIESMGVELSAIFERRNLEMIS